MSTAKIRQVLTTIRRGKLADVGEIEAALDELGAIESAAREADSADSFPKGSSEYERRIHSGLRLLRSIAKDMP